MVSSILTETAPLLLVLAYLVGGWIGLRFYAPTPRSIDKDYLEWWRARHGTGEDCSKSAYQAYIQRQKG